MTWDTMTHEVKKFKGLLKDTKDDIIGFELSGKTYDGDGNPQCERGTDMALIFKDRKYMISTLKRILKEIEKTN